MIPKDQIRQVKQASDIVEVVSETVQLSRAGQNFKGLCPFHDDHNPSMYVSPVRQTFKCWVCGAGGSVVDFVMQRDGLPFGEALKFLAQRAGIHLHLEKPRPRQQGELPTEQLYELMAWAVDFYRERFPGSPAEAEMRRRGFSDEALAQYRVGYAPDRWDEMLMAGARKWGEAALRQVGLVATRERDDGSTRTYDMFRNRVLFPIADRAGRVVGFGGRRLDESDPRKYVNTPETEIYRKSNVLFGLPEAQAGIRESKTAIVMEGYTDVMMAWQHGLRGAVAACGTALTDQHLRGLYGAEQILLLFDGDTAGINAAEKALAHVLRSGRDCRIVTLPDGQDPCDILQNHGAEAFQAALDRREQPLPFKLRLLGERTDFSNALRRADALKEVAGLIAQARDDTVAEMFAREVASDKRFRVDERTVLREIKHSRRRGRGRLAPTGGTPMPSRPATGESLRGRALETAIVQIALGARHLLPEVLESFPPESLQEHDLRAILSAIAEVAAVEHSWDLADIRLALQEENTRTFQAFLDWHMRMPSEAELGDDPDRDPRIRTLERSINFEELLESCRRSVGLSSLEENLREIETRLADTAELPQEEKRQTDAQRMLEMQRLKDRQTTSRRVKSHRPYRT